MKEKDFHDRAPQTRFVVLAMSRVGSYMLTSLLNSHPSVVCFGELLKRNPLNHIDHLGLINQRANSRDWLQDRLDMPIDFLQHCLASAAPASEAVGFKLMLGQNPVALEYVIQHPDFRIILLHRENILASYASQETARLTKQGVALEGEEIRKAKVTFCPENFERMQSRRQRLYRDVRTRLQMVGKSFCDLEYRQATQENGVKQAFKAIDISLSKPPRPRTLKRASGRLIDRFSNPQSVISYLTDIGQEKWLEPEL